MRHGTKETAGYVVNGLSIALFWYLVSALGVPASLQPLSCVGLVLLAIGLCLVALSIAALVRNRGAGLVERGVYSIVRHPMYVGAMILFASFFFFCPHWIMLLISLVNIAIVYSFILQGELQNVARFGDAYRRYMESVPRVNFLAGILGRLRSR